MGLVRERDFGEGYTRYEPAAAEPTTTSSAIAAVRWWNSPVTASSGCCASPRMSSDSSTGTIASRSTGCAGPAGVDLEPPTAGDL